MKSIYLSALIVKFFDNIRRQLTIDRNLDQIKINQGLILSQLNQSRLSLKLSDFEFKVFSQWGEDGIIQYLTHHVAIKNKTFIEFGVEDFFESNCRFLLQKDYWSGFVIDGSSSNIDRLKRSPFYWKYNLEALASFITRENADHLLSLSNFDREIGILSVDIDGIDYFVLEKLNNWKPSILIVEYNALFGLKRAVSVPYLTSFNRGKVHYSNLYYGASLPAFVQLAAVMGMALVGVNSAGSNAFFVQRGLLNAKIREVAVSECFRESSFREGRDKKGELTNETVSKRLDSISQLPLIDVISGEMLKVKDLADSRSKCNTG